MPKKDHFFEMKKALEFGIPENVCKTDKLHTFDKISTGIDNLDAVLQGGFVEGGITQLFGAPSLGKTRLALNIIAKLNQNKQYALIIDSDHTFDWRLARHLGVDPAYTFVYRPICGEIAVDLILSALDLDLFDIILLDSTTSLVPLYELNFPNGKFADLFKVVLDLGVMARIRRKIRTTKTNLTITTQLRKNINYGLNYTTTGGRVLTYYADQRLQLKEEAIFTNNWGRAISQRTEARLIKDTTVEHFSASRCFLHFPYV